METDSTAEEPTEVDLTEEEWERLRELERLSEENESEAAIRVEAWDDLSDYGFADLEAFIEAAKEKRTLLSEKYRETYQEYDPGSATYAGAIESEAQFIAEWRASEKVYQFYSTTIPLEAKLRRARVRGEVAEEIRERRLLGYGIPDSPPNVEDSLVTPLSEYNPSPGAKELLQAVAYLDQKHDELAEKRYKSNIWRPVHEAIDEDGELDKDAIRRLNQRLKSDMEEKEVEDQFPETTEELVTLAREHPDIDPLDVDPPTTL
jgi:hypothetical protein